MPANVGFSCTNKAQTKMQRKKLCSEVPQRNRRKNNLRMKPSVSVEVTNTLGHGGGGGGLNRFYWVLINQQHMRCQFTIAPYFVILHNRFFDITHYFVISLFF